MLIQVCNGQYVIYRAEAVLRENYAIKQFHLSKSLLSASVNLTPSQEFTKAQPIEFSK